MNGSGVGTYGVYSLGLAGQIKDTGWLGYVRVDRTAGANLMAGPEAAAFDTSSRRKRCARP